MTEGMKGQTNNTNLVIGAVVVLVVLLLIGFMMFGMDRDTAVVDVEEDTTAEEQAELLEETPLTATVSATPAVSPSPSVSQAKAFTVTASNFRFDPAEIRVKQGDTVRITLTNTGTMPHDWKIDEFGAATAVINKGQTGTAEFVASKTGTFEYYCSVGTHRQQGMVGKLIVE